MILFIIKTMSFSNEQEEKYIKPTKINKSWQPVVLFTFWRHVTEVIRVVAPVCAVHFVQNIGLLTAYIFSISLILEFLDINIA